MAADRLKEGSKWVPPCAVPCLHQTNEVLELKEIIKQNKGLARFMPKQTLKSEIRYRWSDFVFPFEIDKKKYIYNTFTKQCFEADINIGANSRFSADEISGSDELKTLFDGYFLVPEDKDESVFYEKMISLLRVYGQKKGYATYTILPTTVCNARCVYCYEEGAKQVTMTPETVKDTIGFIMKTHRKGAEIQLAWFGGEPLIGERIIDEICSALKDNGVSYRSSIITNASLITDENVKKMLGLWNMKHIQVSLDGTEGEYIKRKNYLGSSDGIYKKVLENITKLKDIPVILRCNMDEDNIDEVCDFIDELDEALSEKKNIGIDLVPLYGVQSREDGIGIWERCVDAWGYARRRGFRVVTGIDGKTFRIHRCMADNPSGSIVITPDGLLYNCEHCEPDKRFGNIKDGITDQGFIRDYSRVEKTREMCRGCALLPECTSFTRCPVKNANCRYAMEQRMIYGLMGTIEKEKTNAVKG